MENLSKKIKRTIMSLDSFGQAPKIHYDHQLSFQTLFGGFCSLLVIAAVLYLVADKVSALGNKSTLTSQVSTQYYASPGNITLTHKEFMFSLNVWDGANGASFRDHAIFNVQIIKYYWFYHPADQTWTYTEQDIPLKFCEISDFDHEVLPSFYYWGTNASVCPDFTSVTITGGLISPEISGLYINVSQCINGSTPLFNCAPQEYIDEYLANTVVEFVMLFQNRYVEDTNFTQPIQTYMDVKTWFLSPGTIGLTSELLLRPVTVQTQDNILGLGLPQTQQTYRYAHEVTDRDYTPTDPSAYEYLSIQFSVGYFVETYTRRYPTLGDVLAVVGAYYKTILLIVGIIVAKYNFTVYDAKVANDLYELQEDNVIKRNNTELMRAQSNLHEPDSASMAQHSNLKTNERNNTIEFTKMQVLMLSMFPCLLRSKKLRERNQEWEEVSARLRDDSSIQSILKRLREVEKLKKYILVPETKLQEFEEYHIHHNFKHRTAVKQVTQVVQLKAKVSPSMNDDYMKPPASSYVQTGGDSKATVSRTKSIHSIMQLELTPKTGEETMFIKDLSNNEGDV